MVRNNKSLDNRIERRKTILGLIILIGLLTLTFFIICNLVKGIIWVLGVVSKLDAVVIVALITGAVSITGVVINSIIAKIVDYQKSREVYLAQKREKPYKEFISMVYKIQLNIDKPDSYPVNEMRSDIRGFSQELTLWGSDKVASKWIAFKKIAVSPKEAEKSMYMLDDIMNEAKKNVEKGF